jgi:hypothetical protein
MMVTEIKLPQPNSPALCAYMIGVAANNGVFELTRIVRSKTERHPGSGCRSS